MRTLGNIIDSASRINIPYLVSLSLVQSSEEYVRLQQEQMRSGVREDGKPIFNLKTGSDEYSPGYAKYKGKKKPIDLHDTGAFQSDIFLHVDDTTKFIVDSADSKSGKLQDNYGTKIFGLNEQKKVEFKPVAQKNLVTDLINELSK